MSNADGSQLTIEDRVSRLEAALDDLRANFDEYARAAIAEPLRRRLEELESKRVAEVEGEIAL
jgi:hypothetical protein